MKITKSELLRRLEALEEWASGADEMLTELNHALPDTEYDAKCKAVADVEASLDRHRERLDLNEPQLKKLDQSAFNHPYVDDRFNYVALNADGQSIFFEQKPSVSVNLDIWVATGGSILPMLKGYDTTDWQNSLIERESKELTGSDLCRAMLERGDKYVMCLVFDDTRNLDVTYVIRGYHDGYFHTTRSSWENAVPINNQGEPLTASEVGL